MMAQSAVSGRASQATGESIMPTRIRMSLMTPTLKSYIQVHIRPMMTLGSAQGTTTSARASAAPPEALVEKERRREAEQELQPDHADDPDERVAQRDPEDLVAQDRREIAETDEPAASAGS